MKALLSLLLIGLFVSGCPSGRVPTPEAEQAEGRDTASAPSQPPAAPSAPDSTVAGSVEEAVGVIRRYYEAIGAREFRRAYELWEGGGAASGQTLEAFTAGFGETTHVEVEAGPAGRIEAAAGSRYVEVPVVVRARTMAGAAQRFEGTYTLRQAVADGATAEQRRWRIYSADLRRVD